jgi:hypothetical protein
MAETGYGADVAAMRALGGAAEFHAIPIKR